MKQDIFEPYNKDIFLGSKSKAAQGFCSSCDRGATWMRGRRAYCSRCKENIEEKEDAKLHLGLKQFLILEKLYDGYQLYEDTVFGGSSYLQNVLDIDSNPYIIKRKVDRRRLERKKLIKYSRILDSTQIYEITDKGRNLVERKRYSLNKKSKKI